MNEILGIVLILCKPSREVVKGIEQRNGQFFEPGQRSIVLRG
ncbi:hypothetical protein ACPOL_5526 [Acidisarcina polymorpha]|uniref:Uncharacterized protein n=1 Tax=Acidisarcina polymorpha TaxID=2211140 RepID=A0A2Z5G7V2_9BACT|nr:hypothetical protein ACPOL_5526 [Acidisarcina polymorpha]